MRLFILFAALALALAYGCIGGEQPPVQQNNTTNETVKPPINIIIEEQKNQTTEKNETEEEEPPPVTVVKDLEYTYDPDQLFGVYFIEVGGPLLQGDAILIKKGDCDILFDAGSAEKGGKVVNFLKSRNVDDIEVLVSTNADPRHYGGITAVADNFKVEEFWWSGLDFGDLEYRTIVDRMNASAKTVRVIEDGFSADLNGFNLTIINPPVSNKFDDVNNDAIVTRVTDRNFSMLLTSGIQTGAQGRLINQKTGLIKAPIIQAPYYGVGSGTSSIGIFLITAKPDVMILSGSSDESAANGGSRDPYKRLMEQYGIRWYENYKNGTIRISGDGQAYTIGAMGAGQ
ncbi:MBL fold metallo-hydrolase [Candidatus Micrarchaeota archaeon]|nr:MBL fold metallo-hydrolase [Candidatus Micrarchaeota archaeon]